MIDAHRYLGILPTTRPNKNLNAKGTPFLSYCETAPFLTTPQIMRIGDRLLVLFTKGIALFFASKIGAA